MKQIVETIFDLVPVCMQCEHVSSLPYQRPAYVFEIPDRSKYRRYRLFFSCERCGRELRGLGIQPLLEVPPSRG